MEKKKLLKYILRHKYIINHTGTIRGIESVVIKNFPKDSPIENSLLVTYAKIKKLFSTLVYFCVSVLSFKYVFICFIILINWSKFWFIVKNEIIFTWYSYIKIST